MLIIYAIKYVDKAQQEWKCLRAIDKSLHRIDKYLPTVFKLSFVKYILHCNKNGKEIEGKR